MTEEEIAQLLIAIEQLLADLGLGFIVVQERVLAAEGVSQSPAEVATGRGDEAISRRHLDEMLPRSAEAPRMREAEWRWEGPQRSEHRPRFKRGDVVVTPLDVRDRLAILLDLVEVATAGTVVMERDVRDQFEELHRLASDRSTGGPPPAAAADWVETWDGTVMFADPPEAELRGQVSPAWELPGAQPLTATMSAARTVIELLDGLRALAGLSRGSWLAPYGVSDHADGVWNLARAAS